MCLIVMDYRQGEDGVLLLGANRDEFYERPAEGVQQLCLHPWIIGGRDTVGNGTWLALNEFGLLVALTNYRPGPKKPARSRGQLVLEAAKLRSVAEVDDYLNRAPLCEYGPFNLLYGNHLALKVAQVPHGVAQTRALQSGLHVLPSGAGLDDRKQPKVRRAYELLERHAWLGQEVGRIPNRTDQNDGEHSTSPLQEIEASGRVLTQHDQAFERMAKLLADHHLPQPGELQDYSFGVELEQKLAAVCVHAGSYGTRSSIILRIGANSCDYLACDSAPCSGTYVRVDHELPAKRWISS